MTILADPPTSALVDGLRPHAAAAYERAGDCLRRRGVDPGKVSVQVQADERRLRCVVYVEARVDPIAAQMMAVRVVEVLRSIEPEIDAIDVDVVDGDGKLRRVTP